MISVHAPYDIYYEGFAKGEACENLVVTDANLQLFSSERRLGRWEDQKCGCSSKAADGIRTTPQICFPPQFLGESSECLRMAQKKSTI